MTSVLRRRRVAAAVGAAAALLALAACGPTTPAASQPVGVSPPPLTAVPAPTTPSGSNSSPSITPVARSSFTVVAGGDVLLHQRTWWQADADAGQMDDGAYDFAPELASIAPLVSSADLALCHMETPLAPPAGPFSGYPTFDGPPQVAPALAKSGFDACSMASNHSYDQGITGLERTAATLAAAGITPYGAQVDGRPGNPTVIDVTIHDGAHVRVGLLSYAYGFNGSIPAGAGDMVERIDVDDMAADAAAARADGAQIVIASVHWGTEYQHAPNAQQLAVGPQIAAIRDVDLLISHHAHVVEPFAQIDGKWVTYGLGNMLAAHNTDLPDNEEGVLAEFTLAPSEADPTRWTVTRAAYQAIIVTIGPPLRIVPLPQGITSAISPELRARYETGLERTRAAIGLEGAKPVELDGTE